ncbi:hypothetical protein NMG29_04875 [Streptomyces cocklensis]|jgi:hypothetical protein|uniref:Uncharacterized protein n=1 Tax=Actinacidiphila cocklensis TaxID=887465 RepID=A0A9W4GSN4_9ACTN|nr:hypothetical protein [Actinacidiphila cocklensis]MDD1057563.1 hypothetical protein [Actinacidiphila cocklensis]WSX78919.1 hypothetical protein OH826_36755 [Streptomyces sp. NBC_00899]CAG6393810.1 exported hypothetical protein [Actinacidiphila cocklensis]
MSESKRDLARTVALAAAAVAAATVVAAGTAGTASAAEPSASGAKATSTSHSALGAALVRSATAHTVSPNMNHNK